MSQKTTPAGSATMQTETPVQKLAYSIPETAQLLSCHYLTVFRMVKSGRLKAFPLNTHSWRVPKTEIDRIMLGGVK
ncbi:MAG: helix-turn-helix domain-containing protein [Victivallales bacterium]